MAIPSVAPELFPKMAAIRQRFAAGPPVAIEAVVESGLARFPFAAGARVAVAAGSRGIVDIARVVKAAVATLKKRGAVPFVIPAMGSHGGGTPDGQEDVLAGYGITEASVGVPIDAAMDVDHIGTTGDGVAVFCSRAALRADAVVLINRIKPHTDYAGPTGSGLMKMAAIGLGKQQGANTIHRAATRLGLPHILAEASRIVLATAPISCGIALVESATHTLAHVEVIGRDEIAAREPALCTMARDNMARLPFSEIDFLIVDRVGKDVTGTGMDPNVIGRNVHGYNSQLTDKPDYRPIIRRIFARELTPGTHGNAIGIGLADFTTDRLFESIDWDVTLTNALTSVAVQSVKVPIRFRTDRDAIGAALATLALPDPARARVVRIRDTLSLQAIEVSDSCLPGDFEVTTPPRAMTFDGDGNLTALLA